MNPPGRALIRPLLLTGGLMAAFACATDDRSAEPGPNSSPGGAEVDTVLLESADPASPQTAEAPPAPPAPPAEELERQAPRRVAAQLAKPDAQKTEGKRDQSVADQDRAGAAQASQARSEADSAAPAKNRRGPQGDLGSTRKAGKDKSLLLDGEGAEASGTFESREWQMNPLTQTAEDRLSTFAVDVDTAAYSIARRTLIAQQLPNASLVRVEEFLNYFRYDYEQPQEAGQIFTIQADGGRSPVDASKVLLRVGLQARPVSDQERLPANLVFLFDTSCSMTSGDKLELAKTSLKRAVDKLSAKDQVAITTYAGGVRVVLKPTSGDQKAKIKRAIDGLRPGGGTAMASGLELAYRQAAAMLRDNSLTRIIICSDGDANIGATTPEQMLKTVEGYVKEGVFLSTIGFGDGNYKDATMEQIANRGNGNYYYVDSSRQAERIFGRDFNKMIQDVAQDVKIQVEFDPGLVEAYRLVGYENRDVADRDFRNDRVDAGEIGAGHQVTALYELKLHDGADEGKVATVRVRAKKPKGMSAKELAFEVPVEVVRRPFGDAPDDFRFATAVMGGAELLRQSPYAAGWNFARVMSIVSDTHPERDPDRAEFLGLMKTAASLSGEAAPVGMR